MSEPSEARSRTRATAGRIQRYEFAYDVRPIRTPRSRCATRSSWSARAGRASALAIDLAQRGQRVLLLDNDNTLSTGSRAICFAKRTLEIWDRLGVGDAHGGQGRVVERRQGVLQRRAALQLRPAARGGPRAAGVHQPAAVLRRGLPRRAGGAAAEPRDPLEEQRSPRWRRAKATSRSASRRPTAATGSWPTTWWRATARARRCAQLLGQESKGRVFRDRFLIADVRMKADCRRPSAGSGSIRRSIRNQSVLLHRQPDGVWRIDFQLGWDANPDEEKKPENIIPRVKALLAQRSATKVPFELEWASVYTFACLRMDRFRHGRVLFAGDSAHGVSPFGARGANSGVQDAENLAGSSTSCCGQGRRCAARQLCRRARIRGRREHPQLDPRDRLHHAEERDLAGCSATRCSTWRETQPFARRSSTAAGCRCRRRCATRR